MSTSYKDLLEDDEGQDYIDNVHQEKILRKQRFHQAYAFNGPSQPNKGYGGEGGGYAAVVEGGGDAVDEDLENSKYNSFQEKRRLQQLKQQNKNGGAAAGGGTQQYHVPAGGLSPTNFSESVERLRDRQREMEAKLVQYESSYDRSERRVQQEVHHSSSSPYTPKWGNSNGMSPAAAGGGGGSSSMKHLPSPHPDMSAPGGGTLPRATPPQTSTGGRHTHFADEVYTTSSSFHKHGTTTYSSSVGEDGGGGDPPVEMMMDFSNCAPSTIHSSPPPPQMQDNSNNHGSPLLPHFYGTPRTGSERIGINQTPSSIRKSGVSDQDEVGSHNDYYYGIGSGTNGSNTPHHHFKSLAEIKSTQQEKQASTRRSKHSSSSSRGEVKAPFATHFAVPTVYTAPLGPEESTGLMDRYGYRYEGPGDAEIADKERSECLSSRVEKGQHYSAQLEEMMVIAKVKEHQSRKDLFNCADEPSQLSLQLNSDAAARKERSRQRRSELEKQWLKEAEEKRRKDKAEADALKPVEEDWNMLEDMARARALDADSEASQRKRSQQDALESWQLQQTRTAEELRIIEEERWRISELTLSANVANYADRIILAEQQKRRDRESYKRDLDAQIQAKHARNRQLAQEQYERECRLGTF